MDEAGLLEGGMQHWLDVAALKQIHIAEGQRRPDEERDVN